MHVRWIACLLAAGCASGSAGDDGSGCEENGCPRGLVCREARCVEPDRDAGPDARGADTGPDLGPDASTDARPDPDARPVDGAQRDAAAMDSSMDSSLFDASPDAPADAAPDAATPDAAPPACRAGEVADCGSNVGRCRRGRRICGQDGTFGACMGEVGPVPEVCNAADDDCNGTVDDGFGIGDACEGVGRCGEGRLECRDDFQTRCSTDPGGTRSGARMERCDGADDDCDGRTDEDFRLGRDCMGRCGPGTVECGPEDSGALCSTDDGGSESVVRPETCNRRDDDCDGTVDEGFRLAEPCDGVGACGPGTFECGDAGRVRCSTDPGGSRAQAVPEVCNAADDDCDGTVDEGLGVGEACDGRGACGAGLTECTREGALRCSTDPGGTSAEVMPEVCNEVDDDCDGTVDEGLGLGDACPAVGVCAAGALECGPRDAVVCSTHAGGSRDATSPERCNGQDDDCTGAADEVFALGQPCMGRGTCGAGQNECDDAGDVRCSTEPGGSDDASSAEACNAQDDDCDGTIDEEAACSGDDCRTAPPLELGTISPGNTSALGNEYDRSTCMALSPGNDQVFRFEIPAPGNYVVGVAPLAADYDPVWFVAIACDGGRVANCLLPTSGRDVSGPGRPDARPVAFSRADAFWLVVDARRANHGGPFLASVAPVSAGETCASALPLTLPARFVGSTEGGGTGRSNDVATQRCPANRTTTGPDQVFSVQVPRAGRLRVRVTPDTANVDPIVQLMRDCGAPEDSCVAGVDAAAAGGVETLEAAVEPGRYYVVVDHVGNPGGAFFLEAEML